ncbi:MFS transporter [Mycolicibacterium boenickei]|uniref:MFS transporter n=1 Tax=Mycolicibacterium boenickei TaxID=146017 RepID=A0AAX3A5H3_9MYCO|nr:MDR family MFS transporter [Mycolicibacterium boenickei]PEG60297.1 MFS transporter [Mycolicibacterium boenickei]UNC02460.1 MFS transporter [Mycolicibacterium boenickei]BBX92463.1 MFS transporter [Mycolicibacterium boenickei]
MSSPSTTAEQASGAALLSVRRRNLVFVAVLLGMLLASLNQTIVATALPTVVADLGGAGHQAWVVTSYLLASTVVTAVVGKVGDIFGRKVVYQAAVLCFLVGSVLSGLSGSMVMLVAARALQGIGGGAIMVTSSALIAEVIPLRDRGRYQGALGAVFGVTTVAGPLLGGFVTDHLGWRWAFWLSIPVGLVVLVVAAATIPALTSRPSRPVIDYAGIVWVGIGASGLTLATSLGGELAWTSPTIIGLVVGSILALAMFVRAETEAAEPILPMRLFRNPVFTMCCVLSLVVGFAMLGALTFMPTFMQFVDGVSPSESGLRTMPMVLGLLITSTVSGSLVGRTGRYKIYPVAGTAIMLVGFVLLSRMNAATPIPLQSLYLLILGAGIGMCMQVLVLIVQNTSDFSDLGVATSGVTFFRTIGSSFGAAIFGSLFAGFLSDRLPGALAASGAPPAAGASPKALHELPPEVAAPIVTAYSDALDLVFLCAAPVALIGLIVALFLKEVPLVEAEAAVDLGEGFGMPSAESSDQVLETVVSRLMRSSPEVRLRSVAGTAGCELDVAGLWALLKIYRHGQIFGSARLTEIADRLVVPYEVLEPTFNRLVQDGYVLRTGDSLWLTQRGVRQVDGVSAALVGRIVDKLGESPSFEGRPDRAQVEAALERIAHRVVVQRDWGDDREAELTSSGTKN